LPVDTDPEAPNVEAQEKDPLSLLNIVKDLLSLRNKEEDLQSKANLEIVHASSGDRSFVYRRGNCVMAINPSGERLTVNNRTFSSEQLTNGNELKLLYTIGECRFIDGSIELGAQSFGVWKP
jgi:maltose alpha-D-glucosyltransferase/alpha-amylase